MVESVKVAHASTEAKRVFIVVLVEESVALSLVPESLEVLQA